MCIFTANIAAQIYLHERNKLYNFHWDNDRLISALTELRHLQGRLLGQMEILGFELVEKATMETLIADLKKTNYLIVSPGSIRIPAIDKLKSSV